MPGNHAPWWQRFWRYVPERNERGCREWSGARVTKGYGILTIYKGETQRANRLAWMLAYGEIPDGLHVLHRCDNPPCVEITHLFLGTTKDNLQDAYAKGRIATAFQDGEARNSPPIQYGRNDSGPALPEIRTQPKPCLCHCAAENMEDHR